MKDVPLYTIDDTVIHALDTVRRTMPSPNALYGNRGQREESWASPKRYWAPSGLYEDGRATDPQSLRNELYQALDYFKTLRAGRTQKSMYSYYIVHSRKCDEHYINNIQF